METIHSLKGALYIGAPVVLPPSSDAVQRWEPGTTVHRRRQTYLTVGRKRYYLYEDNRVAYMTEVWPAPAGTPVYRTGLSALDRNWTANQAEVVYDAKRDPVLQVKKVVEPEYKKGEQILIF